MTAVPLFLFGILTCVYFEISTRFLALLPRTAVFLLLYGFLAYLFQRSSNDQLKKLSVLIKEAAAGNYSFHSPKTKYRGTYKNIYISIEELKKTFRKHLSEIQVASSQVASASQELNVTLDDNSAFAQQMFAEAHQLCDLSTISFQNIKATVDEIKNLVELLDKVQNTSEQMKKTSDDSKEIIAESLSQIIEIVQSVNTIQRSTDSTVDYINELIGTTKEIASILESVDEIAKATNLLALNASIESARAGEHGKGFGVVAERIRGLSEESAAAVKNISGLVNKISFEVAAVTEKINANKENVQRSVVCTKNVEKSLNQIEQSYSNVEALIGNIIDLSDKGNVLAANTSSKAEEVETTSQQVTAGFETVYSAIQQQKDNIEQLDDLSNYLSKSANSLSSLFKNDDDGCAPISSEQVQTAAKTLLKFLKKKLLSSGSLLSFDPGTHKKILDEILRQDPAIEAIWTNSAKGKFIYSNPPACIANAMVRNWFKESIAGKEYVSAPYISAITKSPCITVALPIIDQSGECAGVLGADLKL